MDKKISLPEAIKFHGHLGPYLVLGILAGESAIKKLKCMKYFGLDVKVWGADEKPISCLIDGLQLSTGATYGKGNISTSGAEEIKIEFCNLANRKRITLKLKDSLIKELKAAKTHRDCELLAKKLYRRKSFELFSYGS